MNTKICPCCGKKIKKRLTRGSVLSEYDYDKPANLLYWYLLPGYKIVMMIYGLIIAVYLVYQKNVEIRPRFKCKECGARLIPFKYLRNEIIAFIVCGLALTAMIIYGIIIDDQIYLIFMPIILVLLFLAVSVPLNFSGGFTFARKMYASYDEEWVNLKVKFEKSNEVSDKFFNRELVKWNLFKSIEVFIFFNKAPIPPTGLVPTICSISMGFPSLMTS